MRLPFHQGVLLDILLRSELWSIDAYWSMQSSQEISCLSKNILEIEILDLAKTF